MPLAPLTANEGRFSLLGQMRTRMRVRRLSPRTEEVYVTWVKRYARFHGLKHPRDMGEREVARFDHAGARYQEHRLIEAGLEAAEVHRAHHATSAGPAPLPAPGAPRPPSPRRPAIRNIG